MNHKPSHNIDEKEKTMKQKSNCNICPLPICSLPEVLTPKQMKLAMVEIDIVAKEASEVLRITTASFYHHLSNPNKYPVQNKRISDYLKAKLQEKAIGETPIEIHVVKSKGKSHV
jgi:hypothetical protein